MELKCISDGTPIGTKIVTPDGTVIKNIQCVDIIITPEGMDVRLVFIAMKIDVAFRAPF